MNGEDGSTEGMYTHSFSGIPPGQYEFRIGDTSDTVQGLGIEDPIDYVGSTFKLTVEVKLGQVATKDLANGTEERLSLRVVNSGPLTLIARGHKDAKDPKSESQADVDPNQMELSEAAGDWKPDEADPEAVVEAAIDEAAQALAEDSEPTGGGGTGKVTQLFSDGS